MAACRPCSTQVGHWSFALDEMLKLPFTTPIHKHSSHVSPRSLLPCGLLLLACANSMAGPNFDRYEIATGMMANQIVLTGFLLGNEVADLAVVNSEEDGTSWLRVFSLRAGGWEETANAPLPSEVVFIDIVNLGGEDCLLTYEPARLGCLEPESGMVNSLANATLGIRSLDAHIFHVDVTRDLNGDALDDIAAYGVGSFSVLVQLQKGKFSDPVALDSMGFASVSLTGGRTGYDPWRMSRIQQADMNGDGRPDLVYRRKDRFAVHLQQEDGRFSPTAVSFRTRVSFDPDAPDAPATPARVRERRADGRAQGQLNERKLHSLEDMNGDGITDLVVFSMKGGESDRFGEISRLWNMRFGLHVHFGALPEGKLEFPGEPGAELLVEGIPADIRIHDFDGDGQKDVMVVNIKPGIFTSIGMLMSGLFTRSVSFDLDFYRMEKGAFPQRRSRHLKIRQAAMGESGKQAGASPPVLIGDFNGDGLSDLLMGRGLDELWIYPGKEGPGLFARRPVKIAVDVPPAKNVWLMDLNRDGKDDIVMHQLSATAPNRVTLLIAP